MQTSKLNFSFFFYHIRGKGGLYIKFKLSYCFIHSQIVMQLPETRRTVFLYISSFLQELLNHMQDNELDAKTLGTFTFIYFIFNFHFILLFMLSHIHNGI